MTKSNLELELEQQKKQLEAALAEADRANRAKSQFLSRVSHNMRTPLNAILGLTSLLKDKAEDETCKTDLKEIEISGQYLMDLINDTLDINKIESGKLELKPVVCDGRTVLKSIAKLIAPLARSKNIKFRMHSDELPYNTLYIDVGRVQQVIMNIMSNAVKFTEQHGTIDFYIGNMSVKNGVITDKIVITDSGIGISPEFIPHIFEPFAQEDTKITSLEQGKGLGLAISKYLIELMGGELSVESELGKGTAVTMIVPMRIATSAQIEQWKKAQTIRNDNSVLRGMRILLCEDQPTNATIAKRMLENQGVLVQHAENGQEGVRMFDESPLNYYDAILMDVRMPVMDGLEATRIIRSLPRQDANIIPIIALSANALEEDLAETKAAGMNAHISKPIQTEMLYNTLAEQMKDRNKIRRPKLLIVGQMAGPAEEISNELGRSFDLVRADTSAQALTLLRQHRGIVAVITDIQLPQAEGIDLIKTIRSNEDWNHIAIIANTEIGNPTQEDQLLSLGVSDFIYKQSTVKLLNIRIKDALHKI